MLEGGFGSLFGTDVTENYYAYDGIAMIMKIPSEHLLNGYALPMEIQFFYKT